METTPSINLQFDPRRMTLTWDCMENITAITCRMMSKEVGTLKVQVRGLGHTTPAPYTEITPGQPRVGTPGAGTRASVGSRPKGVLAQVSEVSRAGTSYETEELPKQV